MARFWTGFLVATALYGAAGLTYVLAFCDPETEVQPLAVEPVVPVEPEPPQARAKKGRRIRSSEEVVRAKGPFDGDDDLGERDAREVDMNAGEEQLSSGEVQSTMDGAIGKVRRCLMLAAGEDVVRGRLVFGLRIEPSGQVSRVNLRGPSAVTSGESGACLRDAARAVRFRSFDGPAMIVSYPITLE